MHVSYPYKLPLPLLRGKSGFFRKNILYTVNRITTRRRILANSAEAPANATTAPEKTEQLSLDEAIEIAEKMLEEAYADLTSISLEKKAEKISFSIKGGKPFIAYRLGTFMGAELLISEKRLTEAGGEYKTLVSQFLKGGPKPIEGKIWIR